MLPSTAIIVPCYNEASRLDIAAFTTFLQEQSNFHFFFVDDGSTDASVDCLRKICDESPENASIITLPCNTGKSEAVRQGVQKALEFPFHFIGFWDADLATPLSELVAFRAMYSNQSSVQMICGSRIKRLGSSIERHWYRHYLGRIIATSISLLLRLPVYDTQCGAKLFTRALATHLFSDPFISRWLFDVELFARTIGFLGRKIATQVIYEYPLASWKDIDGTKISFSYLPKIPIELFRIAQSYKYQLNKW